METIARTSRQIARKKGTELEKTTITRHQEKCASDDLSGERLQLGLFCSVWSVVVR